MSVNRLITMGMVSKTESKFLNSLVQDCITYGLTEPEALKYIEIRLKKISSSSYQLRKANVLSDKSIQIWLNHYTRIGFVSSHKQHIENIQKILDDSLRQLFVEQNKTIVDDNGVRKENRDEYKILRLKSDIRYNTQLLSELNLGTPIISALKAKLEQKNDNPTKAIQLSQ
jgi:hypothetical protein